MVTNLVANGTPQRRKGQLHTPRLHSPWFAGNNEGVTLHRYFDDQFVPRFIQEASSQRLTSTDAQPWYQTDRFGDHNIPCLRLPMHQTFYIACFEVSCKLYAGATSSLPAFDPQRIVNAGFVVRRRAGNDGTQRWMMQEGRALGWRGGAIPDYDPDERRRHLKLKLLKPSYPEPGYSGEEVHPCHPLLVETRLPGASMQTHTLLWGYLPLGGSYRVISNVSTPSAEATQALASELSWPFGLGGERGWAAPDTRPAFRGLAKQALYELLDVLVSRYRIDEASDPDNALLRSTLAEIHFHAPLTPHFPDPFDPYAEPPQENRGESLLAWIHNSRDALLQWLGTVSKDLSRLSTTPLPLQTGTDSEGQPVSSNRSDDLYLTQAQAAQLREQLLQRGGRAMMATEDGMELPRYGQGADDLFFIVPFVRWRDECGCEQILWGEQHSIDFRVASPFDPQAQRPRTVILPELSDIKRGAAKGVNLMVPKSVATLLRKIKPDMDVGPGGPGNPSGLCWSFGLSIPVVTIIAFVLIMIMINLLNLIFWWLPWAILAVPRLCGKVLSERPPS